MQAVTLIPISSLVNDQCLFGLPNGLLIGLLPIRLCQEFAESFVVISAREKGSRGTRGGLCDSERPQCTYCKSLGHTQEICHPLRDFPNKAANISKFEDFGLMFSNEEY